MSINVGDRMSLHLPELDVVHSGTIIAVLEGDVALTWWDHAAMSVVEPSIPGLSVHAPASQPLGASLVDGRPGVLS